MSTGSNGYYTIGEVAKRAKLNTSVLRYWEKEFDELSPKKNKFGHRVYSESDLELVLRLKKLLHIEKHTIKGAKRIINKKDIIKGEKAADNQKIGKVREELKELLFILKKGRDNHGNG